MPRARNDTRERHDEHIEGSYRDDGVSTHEAEERDARTVDEQRAESGETKSRTR